MTFGERSSVTVGVVNKPRNPLAMGLEPPMITQDSGRPIPGGRGRSYPTISATYHGGLECE
jgi:hypothetical protein